MFKQVFKARQTEDDSRVAVAGVSLRLAKGLGLIVLLFPAFAAVFAQEIPQGFEASRYGSLWQNNPFAFKKDAASKAEPSPFDGMVLVSWLKDGGRNVVFLQTPDGERTERITDQPNQSNLRLVALYADANPKLVKAVVSNGTQEGVISYRLGADSEALADKPQIVRSGLEVASADGRAAPQRLYPGAPRVHLEGGSLGSPTAQKNSLKARRGRPDIGGPPKPVNVSEAE
jgi:hypothetical protein